ncbi:ferredoxin--NADP reductase [Agarivorans sp. MS3-6]|uniref:ferredoxin--NADP reductase n=1 Tax=Agarivorans sp. TSD2052 TaxID=2937286 RepID=UPI00200F19FA|nr:ferredoxin--NADP reductase [Agarivorans sp. TSD2052]UPW17580.1 ferredoxin--NADP reductase [Agarivorans sp. TSD2052]
MWTEGKVIQRIDWNEELFSLRIQADISPFTAGQFIKLSEMRDGKRVARAYSLVNPPNTDYLEILAIKVEEGLLSPNLHCLAVGDTIEVSTTAAGFMVLDEVPAGKHLWLIGTGTGIGPYFSMLETPQPWQRFDKIILVYGVRQAKDLAYQTLVNDYLQRYSKQFVYQPMVTREDHAGGIRSRIPEAIENGLLEQQVGLTLDPTTSQVIMCGNPAMITDAQAILEQKGLSKNLRRKPGQITVERYW